MKSPPPPPIAIEGTSIGYAEGEEVLVRVDVPKTLQQSESSRSVEPANVPLLVNYYEVVFRKTEKVDDYNNTYKYYRGEGTSAKGYVSVSVPVGTGYEVLLLAGRDRTLLAAGYLGAANETVDEDDPYPNNDGPVDIKAGQVNRITITLQSTALQWNSVNYEYTTEVSYISNEFVYYTDIYDYMPNASPNNFIFFSAPNVEYFNGDLLDDLYDDSDAGKSSDFQLLPYLQIEDRFIRGDRLTDDAKSIHDGLSPPITDFPIFVVRFVDVNKAVLKPLWDAVDFMGVNGSGDILSFADYNVRLVPRYPERDTWWTKPIPLKINQDKSFYTRGCRQR